MITLSLKKPYLRSVPEVLRPFVKAGRVDDIFRPRILTNGIFATPPTGYGVSFSVGGIDSDGLDRATLDHVSKQIAIANRALPEECIVFEYLITAGNDELPARAITNDAVRRQAQERTDFLRAHARFKSVRLILTLLSTFPARWPETPKTLRKSPAPRCARSKTLHCCMSNSCVWPRYSDWLPMSSYRSTATCSTWTGR